MLQKLTFALVLAVSLFLTACDTNKKTGAQSGGMTIEPYKRGVPFYKHYTGKVNDKEMVMDLMYDGGTFYGYHYYTADKVLLEVNGDVQTGYIVLDELLNRNEIGKFKGVISDGAYFGDWIDSSGEAKYRFELKENYDNNAYAFSYTHFEDSVKAALKGGGFNTATYQTWPLTPLKDDKVLMKELAIIYYADSTKPISLASEKEAAESYFKEFKEEVKETERGDVSASIPYEQLFRHEVVLNTERLLVISTGIYYYDGGTHGNGGSFYFNYDKAAKKEIMIEDVVNLSEKEKLKALLLTALKTQYELPLNKPLNESGFLVKDEELKIPEDFYIRPDGITFMFPVYDIGPYAMGQIDVFVNYKDLKPYLSKGFTIFQ
jgi:hypothetical protein